MFDLFFIFSAFFLRTGGGEGGLVGSREEKIVADKVDCLELTVELNLGLDKSGNFILSGKWQPCVDSRGGGAMKFYGQESFFLNFLTNLWKRTVISEVN